MSAEKSKQHHEKPELVGFLWHAGVVDVSVSASGQHREFKKIKYMQEKGLDMNINISSTAGKHLILRRDQQRIPQQWERGGFESVHQEHLPHVEVGVNVGDHFYILWIIASAGFSNFNHFSFTTFLLRRGNFLTPAVYFWYCSK